MTGCGGRACTGPDFRVADRGLTLAAFCWVEGTEVLEVRRTAEDAAADVGTLAETAVGAAGAGNLPVAQDGAGNGVDMLNGAPKVLGLDAELKENEAALRFPLPKEPGVSTAVNLSVRLILTAEGGGVKHDRAPPLVTGRLEGMAGVSSRDLNPEAPKEKGAAGGAGATDSLEAAGAKLKLADATLLETGAPLEASEEKEAVSAGFARTGGANEKLEESPRTAAGWVETTGMEGAEAVGEGMVDGEVGAPEELPGAFACLSPSTESVSGVVIRDLMPGFVLII